MRIVQVNAVYDPSIRTADDLIDTYHTLSEGSAALRTAGASVRVVQRFHTAGRLERDGVTYEFVTDRQEPWLSTMTAPKEFVSAAMRQPADVFHVNGLIFPALVAAIRAAAGPRVAIVAQHHGGEFPIRGSGLVGMWQRRGWRSGLASADALSFTAAAQADAWRAAGVVTTQRILEIVEASTTIRRIDRARARQLTGLDGDPLLLWVGRLTTNKDPLTVLDGLEQPLLALPHARLAMVFGDSTLRPAVERRVEASERLRSRVTLCGQINHAEMTHFYSASDIFVSGSHAEGSGYALIEAMACGVIPLVTDIPSFRVIAGDCGVRWNVGDATSLAAAARELCSTDRTAARAATQAHFDRALSWTAIAAQTLSAYQPLIDARRLAS